MIYKVPKALASEQQSRPIGLNVIRCSVRQWCCICKHCHTRSAECY